MNRLRQDLIVSLRRLRKSPGFAATAILTLALGIGANTTIFSAVNALIFRPLPVERPDELVYLNIRAFKTELPVLSFPNYRDIRDRNDVVSDLVAYRVDPISFSQSSGQNARVWGYLATGNYFDALGVKPQLGRVLHPDDDRTRRGHPVTVITHAFWQRRFAGDPGVVGRTVKLNGMNYTVVGVTKPGFSGTEFLFTPDLFVPMAMEPQIEPGNADLDERRNFNYFVLGRLKPGVTTARAESALNSIAGQLAREYPKANEGLRIVLSPPGLFGSYMRGAISRFGGVLMAVAGLVLLIACVNLASLMLARASDRRKETAIRLALGAAPGHLVQQLLTESVLLSLAGGAAGLLLAFWLTNLFAAWRPPIDVPIIPALSLDYRVMIFAGVVSLITGVVFGLAPALQSTRAALAPALKNEAVADRLRRFQLRDVLVAAQVALSVVLLVGSVLVVRSLQHALSLNLGFEPKHASSIAFDLQLEGYDRTRGRELTRRLIEKVRALPGIESAGLASALPLSMNWNNSGVFIEGKPAPKVGDLTLVAMYSIGPGYLRTARTRLVAGRDIEESDKQGARRVVLVNEAFVRQFLPNENPIGKRFRHDATEGEWNEIVGVVEDGKYRSLSEAPMPAAFRSFDQIGNLSATVVARSPLPEERVTAMLRRAVFELDPTITLYGAGGVTEQLGLALFPARVAATVLGAFGLLAVVLAATGVYGIMAYSVSRRTREIGIRMALGAAPTQVLRAVLSHTAILVAAGTTVGLALALAGGRLFSIILYGVSPTDPLTYTLALGMMAAVAFVACLIPARRAILVDPVAALRTE